MLNHIIVLVGPPGAGKTSLSKQYENRSYVRISQDTHGKSGHLDLFNECIRSNQNVIIDRLNFNREQRSRYLGVAARCDYRTEITVLHESYDTCLQRCLSRLEYEGHETIKNETHARSALQLFFTKYERPLFNEADAITYLYPEGDKPPIVLCDLDGTLCDIEHRQHFVLSGKKDWKNFFKGIPDDKLNVQVKEILDLYHSIGIPTVFCSGRDENHKQNTVDWLTKFNIQYIKLFMRNRSDMRADDLIKENILDFEILSRYTPHLILDDRDRVVKMWRSRGFKCFQVAPGDF